MLRLLIPPLAFALGFSAFASAETIKAAHGLEFRRFAKEPMLRNAVAVCVDEQGRVYATSVVRRKAADLDIRQFREWIETDLSLTSVEEKRAFYRRELATGKAGPYAKRVKDQNGDGEVDWRDLTVLTDRIIRLEDRDGDGVADESLTFAEGFNTEVTGIAAGVTAWDGTVYATVEPDVWALRDTDRDGEADERQSLATGYSVHIAYAGHNFSGPVVGPDGRLYFSSADKGMNVTSKEGVNFAHPHSGTIARCELDGSHFEVFAYGLRNVQQPAFDQFGNLFGVDNDGDMKGEKERFHYIVEGSDTGWRCNWQYRKDDYNPWIDEGLHVPDSPNRPAYTVPGIQTYRDGPTGFAFNPGTALNEHYRDYFFMSGFPAGKLYAFQLEADGPSFTMKDEHQVGAGFLMTGINFGPDGALYVADWSAKGYELNEKGGVWTLDDPVAAGSDLRKTTATLIAADWAKAGEKDLVRHLGHPDQRVRMKAQFELAKRGDHGPFMAVLGDGKLPLLARLHAIWGLGQLSRHKEQAPWGDPFMMAWADPDPELRAQAAKVAGEAPYMREVAPRLTMLLADPHDRPRFFAAIALGRLQVRDAVEALVVYLAKDGTNPFHRHAGMMGLVGCATPPQLAALSTHESKPVRLAAVVALRRLRAAEVAVFLNDRDPDVVAEAAGAIHDDESIPGAMAALAGLLEKPAGQNERTLRRALSAAQRLRDPAHARAVARFAADTSQPEKLRLAAISLLATWPRPPKLDSVEGRYRSLPEADIAALAATVAEPFASILANAKGGFEKAARAAAAAYGIGTAPEELLARVKADTPDAAAALRLLAKADSKIHAEAIPRARASKHAAVRAEALRAEATLHPQDFPALAAQALAGGELVEQRRALELLGASTEPRAAELLRDGLKALAGGSLAPELQLDLLEAATASKDPEVAAALSAYQAAKDSTDPLSPYLETLHGGDVARGRRIFNNHLAAQCVRCHAAGPGGADVGPNLARIGQKDPRYLLESLVAPNAVVAPGYGVTSVNLKSGESLTGTLAAESGTGLTIVLADGTTREVPKSGVASSTPPASSMPPMALIVTKRELRDLNAYLQSLK